MISILFVYCNWNCSFKPAYFTLRDLGDEITRVSKAAGCSVVTTYCGHGIGQLFHTVPNVPHYAKNKAKGTMQVLHC